MVLGVHSCAARANRRLVRAVPLQAGPAAEGGHGESGRVVSQRQVGTRRLGSKQAHRATHTSLVSVVLLLQLVPRNRRSSGPSSPGRTLLGMSAHNRPFHCQKGEKKGTEAGKRKDSERKKWKPGRKPDTVDQVQQQKVRLDAELTYGAKRRHQLTPSSSATNHVTTAAFVNLDTQRLLTSHANDVRGHVGGGEPEVRRSRIREDGDARRAPVVYTFNANGGHRRSAAKVKGQWSREVVQR